MSYWVYLKGKKGEVIKLKNLHSEGGTYILGGSDIATLNVTYNYSKYFSVKKELDGKTAKDTIKNLENAINSFGIERDEDYWNPTKGNVGYMCNVLLSWAKENIDAIWEVQ